MSSGISTKPDQAGHGSPFLSFSAVFKDYFLPNKLQDLMDSSEKEKEVYSIKKGDIFLTRTSETLDELGMSSVAIKEYPDASFSGFLKRLRPIQDDISYDKFMAFYLRSKLFRKTMNNNAIMTLRASLNEQIFSYLNLLLPPYSEQKKIGDFLYLLNEKIELNNKIKADLESMAKLLYDYWFMQFDFPDKESKPYKSSGGKMVYNEILKRMIPMGWDNCILGDVICRTGTGLNPRDNFVLGLGNNYYVTIKNIEQGRVILDKKCDKVNDKSLEIINNRSDLRAGDILYTSIQPVGTTYLLRETPQNWNINESVFTIRPNYDKVSSEFLYMFLSDEYIKAYTKNVSAGSIHKGVRHGTLKACKFILPPKDIIIEFSKKIKPLFDKQHIIDKENQRLAELRDWLLPMLMNGQVTVGSSYEKEDEKLALAAEPGLAYEIDKTAIDALFETINHDYEVAVIQLLTDRRFGFTYGKKYTHKMFSNIEMLNTMPKFKALAFEEKGWGMFSKAIAKTIDKQTFIFFNRLDNGVQVLKVRPKSYKDVLAWMVKEENKAFVTDVENMLTIYEKPLINKEMDRIELFNTVLECMKVLETDNLLAIRAKMANWKMKEDYNKTKAEKFSENETLHMIQFIKTVLRV